MDNTTSGSDETNVSKADQALETGASSSKVPSSTGGLTTTRRKTKISLYDDIVSVIVGANAKKFGLHKGLLCHHSSFFNSALNGSFKEAAEKSVTLAEESECTFAIFVAWLYSQKLISERDGRDSPCSIEELLTLYIFGDRLEIPELELDVMDTLIKRLQSPNPSEPALKLVSHIVLIYNNTPDLSPLRKLLVDVMVYDHKIPGFITDNPHSASWTPELLRDLLIASMNVRSKSKIGLENAPFAFDTGKY